MKYTYRFGTTAAYLVISLILLVVSIGCARGNEPVSTNPFRFLIADSVDLDVGDAQSVFEMEPPPGSVNEFGYYLSPRFFLASGEIIQVVVTADAPITLTGAGKSTPGSLQTGLNSIGEEDEPTTNIDLSYFTLATSPSAVGEWELTYTFPAERMPSVYWQVPSGYYQLNIFNASGKEAHLEYSIILKQK